MASESVEKGDTVSWQWSGSRPQGEVADVVKEGEASVTSHRGNEIKKNAEPDDPAITISRSGNDVVKKAHEVDVEEKASGAADGGEGKEQEDEKMKDADENAGASAEKVGKENGEPQTGEKRDIEEVEKADDKAAPAPEKENGEKEHGGANEEESTNGNLDEEEPPAKKTKTDEANGEKKGRGRPKKGDATGEMKAPAKKKEPKKAATESGQPRRSSRSAAKVVDSYAE